MNFPQTLIVGSIVIPAAFAQFGPYFYDVRNSASYASLIAQGSIFTVFGDGIGPARLEQANTYPLPLQVGGTSMQIITGGKRLDCPMIYSSNRQAAAILPSSTPPGEVTLNLNYGGKTASGTIQVVTSVFGAYTTDRSGTGAAIVTGLDYGVKSFAQSARPGEILLLWGTGLGAIEGSDANVPAPGKQFSAVEVFVGNLPAKIVYAGRSGCCAGLDQIAFEMPLSSDGCFVPIAVRTNGIVSNFTTLAVSRAGPSCSSDPPGVPVSILSRVLAGEEVKVGTIALGPVRILESAGFPFSRRLANTLSAILQKRVSEEDAGRLVDAYRTRRRGTARIILKKYGVDPKHLDPRLVKAVRTAAAMDEQGVGVGFGRLRSVDGSFTSKLAANFTAPGTCIVTRGFSNYRSFPRSARVDAGSSLTFDGPIGRRTLPRASNGQYMLSLGSGFAYATLPAGRYTITGSGGADIGAFSASLNVSNPLVWTNKAAISAIDRTRPLTITWAGGSLPGYVLIGGGVHVTGSGSTAFLCSEESRMGTFTVPSFVLGSLPAAEPANGTLFISASPLSNIISVPGLDFTVLVDASSDYKSMAVR